MLRHSCGYKLANDGQDTRAIQECLSHRSIVSTQRCTALSPHRFRKFWEDKGRIDSGGRTQLLTLLSN
jgi:type 1 fimbriae regulatory protein FimB/type 1 fimbriae regulatory protein FimE